MVRWSGVAISRSGPTDLLSRRKHGGSFCLSLDTEFVSHLNVTGPNATSRSWSSAKSDFPTPRASAPEAHAPVSLIGLSSIRSCLHQHARKIPTWNLRPVLRRPPQLLRIGPVRVWSDQGAPTRSPVTPPVLILLPRQPTNLYPLRVSVDKENNAEFAKLKEKPYTFEAHDVSKGPRGEQLQRERVRLRPNFTLSRFPLCS